MEQDKNPAVNTGQSAATDTVVVPLQEDYEAQLLKKDEEIANWKTAALKFKSKARQGEPDPDEDEDARVSRIVDERLASSELARVSREKDELIAKALKENKELKLAQLNSRPGAPASMGTHSEGAGVKDTLVTPEQMALFKSQGKTDEWIAQYKKNLMRNPR